MDPLRGSSLITWRPCQGCCPPLVKIDGFSIFRHRNILQTERHGCSVPCGLKLESGASEGRVDTWSNSWDDGKSQRLYGCMSLQLGTVPQSCLLKHAKGMPARPVMAACNSIGKMEIGLGFCFQTQGRQHSLRSSSYHIRS